MLETSPIILQNPFTVKIKIPKSPIVISALTQPPIQATSRRSKSPNRSLSSLTQPPSHFTSPLLPSHPPRRLTLQLSPSHSLSPSQLSLSLLLPCRRSRTVSLSCTGFYFFLNLRIWDFRSDLGGLL
jgi:hypothetical protein